MPMKYVMAVKLQEMNGALKKAHQTADTGQATK